MRLWKFSIKAISLLVMNHRRTDTMFRWDINTQMLPRFSALDYIFFKFPLLLANSETVLILPITSQSHFLLLNSCLRYLVKQCRPGSTLLRHGANDTGFPEQAQGEQN